MCCPYFIWKLLIDGWLIVDNGSLMVLIGGWLKMYQQIVVTWWGCRQHWRWLVGHWSLVDVSLVVQWDNGHLMANGGGCLYWFVMVLNDGHFIMVSGWFILSLVVRLLNWCTDGQLTASHRRALPCWWLSTLAGRASPIAPIRGSQWFFQLWLFHVVPIYCWLFPEFLVVLVINVPGIPSMVRLMSVPCWWLLVPISEPSANAPFMARTPWYTDSISPLPAIIIGILVQHAGEDTPVHHCYANNLPAVYQHCSNRIPTICISNHMRSAMGMQAPQLQAG